MDIEGYDKKIAIEQHLWISYKPYSIAMLDGPFTYLLFLTCCCLFFVTYSLLPVYYLRVTIRIRTIMLYEYLQRKRTGVGDYEPDL